MPTIVIPTQQQLQQMWNDPTTLLAQHLAAQAPKPRAGSLAPQNAPGVAPGTNPTSQTVVTPVATPAPVATPQINYAPQNNEEWIKATTEMINQINMQAQQAANAGRIPGGTGLESKSSANIGSALSGALPADVIYQIGQRAAERGVGTGSPHGANTNADYLRAIGLNSLQLQNTGQDWLTAALARNPAAPIFDPSKLLITPTQATGFGLDQANFQLAQQRQQTEIANANAQRQLQSDLANASNQLERDRLVWQYEQNRLNRENALRIAEMEAATRRAGYGRGAGGTPSGGGGFNPATNWSSGSGAMNVFSGAWSDPGNPANPSNQGISDEEWAGLAFGLYPELENFESNQGINWTPETPEPYADYYNPGGGINTSGMSEEELDWLYNVGG